MNVCEPQFPVVSEVFAGIGRKADDTTWRDVYVELIANTTPIGEILLEDGVISEEQLAMAIKIQEPARRSGEHLVRTGIISQGVFALMLEVQMLDILGELGYVDEEGILGRPRMADIPHPDVKVRHL